LRREARIILIIHTNLEAQLSEGSDSLWRFLRIPYLVFEMFALKLADVVISHSSADAPRLKKKKPDMEVMPGWYSDRHFVLTSPPPSRGGMIWVGRFEKVKDPLLAVQAFAALPEGHGSSLSLVGSGSMRAEIEAKAETLGVRQALILQDPLDPADLCQLMQQHRILLHTSHFEGSPRVLLEALASGLVVVTLPECDPDRWVEKTGAGIYAESRSPEDIARAIESAPTLEPREISKSIEFRAGSRIIPHLENLFLRRP
jgi:glycosyltransferase involved in cell wall biosynthesis